MEIQLKVMGAGLFQHLSQHMTTQAATFPRQVGTTPITWTVTPHALTVRPEDLLCFPDAPRVLIVEAHDMAMIEQLQALEERWHAYLQRHPDVPMVLCPIILVLQSPAILVASADFPDIVADWLFLPVALSDLSLRVVAALKRKGMVKVVRPSAAHGERILSEREVEILRLANAGMKNSELARRLFLSETTIKWHLRNVYTKFNVNNRTGAIARARELALL